MTPERKPVGDADGIIRALDLDLERWRPISAPPEYPIDVLVTMEFADEDGRRHRTVRGAYYHEGRWHVAPEDADFRLVAWRWNVQPATPEEYP